MEIFFISFVPSTSCLNHPILGAKPLILLLDKYGFFFQIRRRNANPHLQFICVSHDLCRLPLGLSAGLLRPAKDLGKRIM